MIALKVKKKLLVERILTLGFFLFLGVNLFSGPLRYFLNYYDSAILIYLPTIILIFSTSIFVFRIKVKKNILFISMVFVAYAFWGLLVIQNPKQVGFGLWIFVPFFFGIVTHDFFENNFFRFRPFFLICFVVAVSGVYIDIFIDYKWSGLNYMLGEVDIEAVRQWTAFGLERPAGFSRASFSAATQILIFNIYLFVVLRKCYAKILVWVVGGIAIVVTTTKGVVLAFLVFSVFSLTWKFLPKIWPRVAGLFLCLVVFLPLTVFLFDFELSTKNFSLLFLFYSLNDRLLNTWPEGFDLNLIYGNFAFGRGFGGIGTAQKYFENSLYSPADNLFIYLYISFGILSIVILSIYFIGMYLLDIRKTPIDRFIFLIIMSGVLYGLTNNVVEDPLFSLFMGIGLAHLVKKMTKQKIIPCQSGCEI